MIYNIDFWKGFEKLKEADKELDIKLVVTSPPYLDARDYGGVSLFESADVWMGWCVHSIKMLAEWASVIWWNTGSGYKNHHKLTEIYKMIVELEWRGVYLIDEIPWIKTSAPPKNIRNRPYPAWEHNFIFSKDPENAKFYRDNVRRPYAKSTLSRMKYKLGNLSADMEGEYGEQTKTVSPNPKGATPPNHLTLPQDTSRRPHPAPMLPLLADWAIRAYSEPGDLVCDPMAGIGTTWIEATKLGREFIGFELFPEYIEIANLSMERYKRGDDPYNGLKKEWEENYVKPEE